METTTDNYILSPILDHKEKYDLGGHEILIVKDYENNLRRRNCQLGIVEAIPTLNPLKLSLGDIVFVHHFSFHGDIGQGRSFTLRPHAEVEGKKIFRLPVQNIFFRYNEEIIEPLGDIIILEEMYSPSESKSGLILESKPYKDRGRIVSASDDTMVGKVVFVEPNSLYPLELKDKAYFKIFENEIVGYFEDDVLFPAKGRVLLQDFEEDIFKNDLDLSMIRKTNCIRATVIRTGDLDKVQHHDEWIKKGDTVLRFRNYGVKYEGQVIVALADDNIHGVLC